MCGISSYLTCWSNYCLIYTSMWCWPVHISEALHLTALIDGETGKKKQKTATLLSIEPVI